MAKFSHLLCENPIVTFCTFVFCCSCMCDYIRVVCYETDNSDSAYKYELEVDAYAVRNQRASMEDRYFIDEQINGTDVALFAVFDGHGGKYVSTKARSQLMPRIRSKIQEIVQAKLTGITSATKVEPYSAKYYVKMFATGNSNLVEAFKQMLYDEIMRFDERMLRLPRNDACGSTAVIAIVTGHHLIVANVGDSRAILGNTSDKAIRITIDHKPEDADERARIESVPNGRVTRQPFDVPRVNGILAMSRALGDNALKRRQFIIATPDLFVIDFNEPRYHPKYLVIASDGIWDVLGDQQVINSINEYADTDDIAKQITQDAINWYSRDNIAILIISFEKKVVTDNDDDQDDDDDDNDDDDGIVEDDDDDDDDCKHDEL